MASPWPTLRWPSPCWRTMCVARCLWPSWCHRAPHRVLQLRPLRLEILHAHECQRDARKHDHKHTHGDRTHTLRQKRKRADAKKTRKSLRRRKVHVHQLDRAAFPHRTALAVEQFDGLEVQRLHAAAGLQQAPERAKRSGGGVGRTGRQGAHS